MNGLMSTEQFIDADDLRKSGQDRRRGRIERKHKEKDLWHERRLAKEQ